MRIVKTPQLPSRKVCMKRLSLGWPGACHSAWLLLSNQSSFPSRPVHEHALILQPGLLCPHIRRSASSQQGWESVRPGTEPNGSNGPKKLIEIDQTSLIWAPFLRTGHMHCRTGRPASQHVASKCFKPPEIAWNSLIVSGPNTHKSLSQKPIIQEKSWHLRSICWVLSLKGWPRHEPEGPNIDQFRFGSSSFLYERSLSVVWFLPLHFGPRCFVGSFYWSY